MTSRLLPCEEWSRLAETELAPLLDRPASDVIVMVVEDEAGAIVACWGLFHSWHAEGLWLAPQHRGKGGAARRLLRTAATVAEALGITHAITGAASETVTALLKHRGAIALPPQFVVALLKEPVCPPSPSPESAPPPA